MNVELIQASRVAVISYSFKERERPAIIRVNGASWVWEIPSNSGKAESINSDALNIVEFLKRT